MEIHFKDAQVKEQVKDGDEREAEKLRTYTEKRLRKLQKYVKAHTDAAHIYVEFGKSAESHQNGKIWQAQINVDVVGKQYHASAVGERIEIAVATAVRELEAEMRKAKQRQKTEVRKGGNVVKSFMRGFRAR